MKFWHGLVICGAVSALLWYGDTQTPKARRCEALGGQYDVLSGGYSECTKLTITHFKLD